MSFDICQMRNATVAAMLAAALAMAVPISPALAQAAAAKSDVTAQKKSPDEAQNSLATKALATKAIEAAKNVAKDASDILSRVPCLPPKGLSYAKGSLPRVAKRLASGSPITIVALGSSSTVGYGTTSPTYTYPNRLADQLRRKYPSADIQIVNRGMGGQDTKEMIARFQTVVAANPDLVIWQLGTNTVVKGGDIPGTAVLIEEGISRLQAQGIDVVLVDPQYAPVVTEKKEGASKMVNLIKEVGQLKKVSVFPRFEVMRQWHEDAKMPFDSFVIQDGLHMNDWGYACFAQLLGDTIIRSVGEVKVGIEAPTNVMSFKPM